MGKAGRLTLPFILALLSSCAGRDQDSWPLTTAESSAFEATSSSRAVEAYLQELSGRSPLLSLVEVGRSSQGRPLSLVLAADPPVSDLDQAARDKRPKVLIQGNIHAGEVEGKEALQIILREIAEGRHKALVRDLVLVVLPNYNPDGNDATNPRHRRGQNGPHCPLGQRRNGQNLDLNRDFMKVRAPETRALLRVMNRLDPVLFVDCHTTDGSYHGFALTYAPPLSPATDKGILAYLRQNLLPRLRRTMMRQGFRIYDYGNWRRRDEPKVWRTFDARPRFSTNYVGLRGRLALLSEAYSHAPFKRRIAATRAFVLNALKLLRKDLRQVVALLRQVDRRARRLATRGGLPTSARLAFTEKIFIPVSSVRRVPFDGGRRLALAGRRVHTWLPIASFVHFEGIQPVGVPWGWILARPPAWLLDLLVNHGIRFRILKQPLEARSGVFRVTARIQAARSFEGQRPTRLVGNLTRADELFEAGSLLVPASQKAARLAFMLLEPRSNDGLAAWDLLRPVQEQHGGWTFPIRTLIHPLQGR